MAGAESTLWEAELRREIERLRAEVRELRNIRDELVDELALARGAVRRAEESGWGEDHAGGLAYPATEFRRNRRSSGWIAMVGACGLAFAIGVLTQRPGSGASVAASTHDSTPAVGTGSTGRSHRDASAIDAALRTRPKVEVAHGAARPSDAIGSQDVDQSQSGGVTSASEAAGDGELDAGLRPERAGSQAPLPRTIAEIDKDLFGEVEPTGEPCIFAAEVFTPEFARDVFGNSRAPTVPALRKALGPCFGHHVVMSGGGTLPAGTHRVDGVPCCRHHAYIERLTGASHDEKALKRLLEEAELATRDGLLPPLVRRRAGRSALRFLEDRVGRWSEAGIDSGTGSHRWERLDPESLETLLPSSLSIESATVLRLHSWVRPTEGAVIRRFTMDLALSDGRSGDVLVGFRSSSE